MWLSFGFLLVPLCLGIDTEFVTIHEGAFKIDSQAVMIKGTNYYPRTAMWAAMWTSWPWAEIVTEVQDMVGLGINTVRILVPYHDGGWNGPNVPSNRIQQLVGLVDLLGSH